MGKLEDWEIGKTEESHYMWRKIRASWNTGGFRRLGDWEIREIREIGRFGRLGEVGNAVGANT